MILSGQVPTLWAFYIRSSKKVVRMSPVGKAEDGALLRWAVAVGLALVGFIMYGAGAYGFIMFAAPIAEEFHWSEAAMGGLVSAFWLMAPVSLGGAKLIQRFGSRQMILAGIVIEAICFAGMIFATQLWQLYLLRALSGLGKVLFAITVPITVSKLFSRNYGFAISINYAGWQLGGVVIAPLASYLISSYGWRTACIAMGSLVLAALLPGLWVMSMADRAKKEPGEDHVDEEHVVVSYRDVVSVPGFMAVLLGTFIFYNIYGGVLAHQPTAVSSAHVSVFLASLVLGSTAAFAAIGSLLMGWLIDRLGPLASTLIPFAFFTVGIASLVALVSGGPLFFLILHAIFFGLGIGACDVFWNTTIKRSVKTQMFPAAWGLGYFALLVGIVLGPMLAGALNDVVHSFSITLGVQLLILLIPFGICIAQALRKRRGGDKF